MKKIKLTQNKYALVDNTDFAALNSVKWRYDSSNGYATRLQWETGKTHATRKAEHVYMHRLILQATEGMVTDHINGNRLDNRRTNLRVATHSQNHANKGLQKNNTSGFKGVRKRGSRWHARIKVNKKVLYLGTFNFIEDAAHAYNKSALEHFGEFALLNKV